jgi:hypothetical protein
MWRIAARGFGTWNKVVKEAEGLEAKMRRSWYNANSALTTFMYGSPTERPAQVPFMARAAPLSEHRSQILFFFLLNSFEFICSIIVSSFPARLLLLPMSLCWPAPNKVIKMSPKLVRSGRCCERASGMGPKGRTLSRQLRL